MTFDVEYESEKELPFDAGKMARKVIEAVLDYEECPYETEVHLVITDNEEIRKINEEFRGIDRPTDVLSFPMADYETPGDFSKLEEQAEDYFNPETGELMLGDIVVSVDKVFEQAESYGHSVEREFAFLIAHSMLHLCGYDHMSEEDAAVMESRQKSILDGMGITR